MPVYKTYRCPHCKHRFASSQTRAGHLRRREVLGRCPVNVGGYQPKRFTYLQDLQLAGLVTGVGKSKKRDYELARSIDVQWT